MTVQVAPDRKFTGFDNNGNKASGGKLFVYLAGTTTKTNSFTDSTGVTPNTNPVVLNTRGEADVWLTAGTAYKFVLSPSTDSDPPSNAFWTADGLNAGSAPANDILVSGTNTITAFDTVQAGTERTLEFQGSLTLTNNNTTLILPGAQNITTQAGDTAIFRSEGSGNWRCISYSPAQSAPFLRSYLAGLIVSNDVGTPNTVLDISAGICADSTNQTYIKLGAFTNTTAFRRIGSFLTDGSAHILTFFQVGDWFFWKASVLDQNAQALGTVATSYTLASVPPGVQVMWRGVLGATNAAATNIWVYPTSM